MPYHDFIAGNAVVNDETLVWNFHMSTGAILEPSRTIQEIIDAIRLVMTHRARVARVAGWG